MRKSALLLVSLIGLAASPVLAHEETPEEWVRLGSRVHGGFGAFIPVGIRIGLDALQRLEAKPREVGVTYYDSEKAPCACVGDGIMLATTASPGQRSFAIAAEKAPEGAIAVAVVRHKTTGKAFRYTVPTDWMPKLAEMNRTLDPVARYHAVMKAEGLFQVEPEK